ncbi:MAG TPA: CvpA family protein [Candidatus Binatia bacterium]|nr:CvpA family protein [Candidatus Binatia bacterium]
MTWPDIVIVAFALIAALRGWKRGFVSELAGFVALALGLWAGYRYDGVFDATIAGLTHLGPGSAHVVGMAATAFLVYAALLIASLLLGRVAKLPVLGLGNSIAGGALGIIKAGLVTWAVLYIALFFPLSPDLRSDLHRSPFVAYITQSNAQLDGAIEHQMPWFIRPFVSPLFAHHRV